MENITQKMALDLSQIDPASRPVITLDSTRYDFYQTSYLEIHAPDGTPLECIGKFIQNDEAQINDGRLYNQLCLVEDLFDGINGRLALSAEAVEALVDLMCRSKGLYDKCVK